MSGSNCHILAAYRFLNRQVRWSAIIILAKGLRIVSEVVDVFFFLELPCFFYDRANVGNLISGSSAFSKSSLYIWKFLVDVLLKPSLKDFEYYLASI